MFIAYRESYGIFVPKKKKTEMEEEEGYGMSKRWEKVERANLGKLAH